MVKLKKYTLKRIPKFAIYTLNNPYLSSRIKHIKVFDYSQDNSFIELVEKLFRPSYVNLTLESGINLTYMQLTLSSLLYLTVEHKESHKFLKFVDKLYTESKQLKTYFELIAPFCISIESAWNVKMTLVDIWNYD